jgi:putative Ca2+/H+ antiporter (TMEM165/GDT1 family)
MSFFDLSVAASTFLVILPAELPDKTFVASLVLATRFPRPAVWAGVTLAFGVQCLIAVTAGGLLALLPGTWVAVAAGVLFGLGALVMLRGGLQARADWAADWDADSAEAQTSLQASTNRSGFFAAFGLIFVAEWGDLSQLLTAGLSARTGQPLAVFLGAWAALAVIAALAVAAGGWLTARIPMHRVRLVAAGCLAVLSVLAFLDAARS